MSRTGHLSQPLIYALPAWPLAMVGIPIYLYLPNYYHHLGVDLAIIGTMLLLARLSDILTDPLIGIWRDRLSLAARQRMMVGATLLLLIALWQLLLPTTASGGHLLLWGLMTYLAWSLLLIPYQALTTEVCSASHRTTHFTASREVLTILGMLTVFIVPVAFDLAVDRRPFFTLLYPLIALSLILSLALLLWRLQLPFAVAASQQSAQPWRRLLRQIWHDRPSRRLLPAYFLNSLANALPATLFLLFVEYYLRAADHGGQLLLVYFLSGIIALPLWAWLAQRIGKYRAWQFSILVAAVSFIWVLTLEAGDIAPFYLICAIAGLSVGADVALPSSIQADIAQRLSQQSGAVGGLLFGVWGVLSKLALALAVGIALPLLDALGWQEQSSSSITALLWLYAALPVALKTGVLIWLRRSARER
jgi:glycoside/pentoside/hexuronide:cation symporter, GPH family